MASSTDDSKKETPVEEKAPEAIAEESAAESKEKARSIELAEEAKLRARLPVGTRPASAFLHKRLGKGQQKYFDSGDYQMALQKPHNKSRMPPLLAHSTGEAIPTPDSVPARKTSIIQQPKLAPSTLS